MTITRFHLAAGLVVLGTPLTAQSVHGRALAPLESSAVAGALVQLVDSAGHPVAQTFADRRGAFALVAPRPGTYSLRGLRIGWRPSSSPPFVIPTGAAISHSLFMTGGVVALAAQQVSATSECALSADSVGSGFAAWEQARQALLATQLTRADPSFLLRWILFERQQSVASDTIITEWERDGEARMLRPFQAVAADLIADSGYVRRLPDGSIFMAPDEDILLSDRFAEAHCIRLVAQAADADSIVVGFEPVPARSQPEIAGAFVLDRKTGALRRMRFSYVHLRPAEESAHAGGEIHFRPLPLGRWLIDAWSLRLPVTGSQLVRVTGSSSTGLSGVSSHVEHRDTLAAVQTTGGRIYWARDGERVLWSEHTIGIAGRVGDSLGVPLAGARVSLVGATPAATTDANGAFTMPDVLVGRRVLAVTPAYQDSLGAGAFTERVEVDSSGAELIVLLPTRDATVASVCRDSTHTSGATGFLRGAVRDGYGSRVPGAALTARWQPAAYTAAESRTLSTTSDSRGDYLVCGLPLDTDLRLDARASSGTSTRTLLRIPRMSRFVMTDLVVRMP